MKSFFIFTAVFLFIGICSVAAQDIIVLRDGSMIEAKVSEISPTEIRYKRFNNLDGPTIVIPADRVLSIRYQNGNQEIINAEAKPAQKKPVTPAMDPDKFIFAFNLNPGGLLISALGGLGGPALCLEFGKGHFNSELNIIPRTFGFGFGGLATFNYFWPNSVGGFYLGGGIGYFYIPHYDYYTKQEPYQYYEASPYGGYYVTGYRTESHWEDANIFTIGLNIGWKFVLKSGLYFRTGTYIGAATCVGVYIKPDLAIGYCFK